MDEKTEKIEAAKISHRNRIYTSLRFRKGNMGDWLDGVEDDFEAGAEYFEMHLLPALIEQARREGFRAARETVETYDSHGGYTSNHHRHDKYKTEDDYIKSLKGEGK